LHNYKLTIYQQANTTLGRPGSF